MFTQAPAVVDDRQAHCESPEAARRPALHEVVSRDSSDPRRAAAEAFIRAKFMRTHGARVVSFMPGFLLTRDATGGIDAVAGYRRAETGPLYLERYLDCAVEKVISARTGARVSRSRIVEVGNFAATDSRAAGKLMAFLAPHFLERDLSWIVFTATDSIRRILASLGARCLDLGAAEDVRAANDANRWGSYYSRDPRVMAGYLPTARRIPALWRTSRAD